MTRVEEASGDPLFDVLIGQPDLDALDAWLATADDAQLRWAAAWHRKHRNALLEYRSAEAFDAYRARKWVSTLLVASTAAPVEAVKKLDWNDWWYVSEEERALVRRSLGRRTREWAAAFVPAAAQVKIGRRRDVEVASFLFSLLDHLVRQHDLPVPDGDAFLHGWALRGSQPHRYLPVLLGPLLSSSHLRHRPDLPAVIDTGIASGDITRASTVAAVLESLVAPIQPSAQRVLARVLAALDLTPEELDGRLPLLQGALATAHGSITTVVLPLAVSLAADGVDLEEIAAVIAGRSEKRQRATLLVLLQGDELRLQLGDAAVLGALAHLDACDDAALSARIARFRRPLGDPGHLDRTVGSQVMETTSGPMYEGMWRPMVRERPAPEPLRVPTQLFHSDVRRVFFESSRDSHARVGRVDRIGDAMLLACLVRAAAVSPTLRSWLSNHTEDLWDRATEPLAKAIVSWLRGDLDHGPIYEAQFPVEVCGDAEARWRSHQLVGAAIRESLWRADRCSTVLSTPSRRDGTLGLGVLLRRVVKGQVPSYTPHDLAQALLRLRPVTSADRDLIAGLGTPTFAADADCWAQHCQNRDQAAAAAPDGIELIRRWIDEGGLRPQDAEWDLFERSGPDRHPGWYVRNEPPLPTGVLHDLLLGDIDLVADGSTSTAVTLVPSWTDLAASGLQRHWSNDTQADVLIEGPGPMGTPSHAVVLAPLGGPPERQRLAVNGLLELIQRDTLSEVDLRRAVWALHQAGRLPLPRVVQGLEQAFDAGALADLWSVALHITADASNRRPLPAGLPQLLRLLAAYVPAVPDRDLPVEITELAAARNESKSRAEARSLMAACAAL